MADKQLLYWIVISFIVFGETVYLSIHDKEGFLNIFLTILGIVLESFMRCCCNNIQERLLSSSPSECFRPLKASKGKIILAIVLDLFAILWYSTWTNTHPFNVSNCMLILRVIALGTFFRHLIITEEKVYRDQSDEPKTLREVSIHEVSSSYYKTLKKRVKAFVKSDKFSLASLSEGSGQMRLTELKIIVLVSPFKIGKKLNKVDRSIRKLKTDCECFPVYSWVYSDQTYTYVILRAEAPFEMIRMTRLDKGITNERLYLHRHMKVFHDKLIDYFLGTGDVLTSSRCIPVFVEKAGCHDGWLIECIMDHIRPHQVSESPTAMIQTNEATGINGSNLRNRKSQKSVYGERTEPMKEITKASQLTGKLPDQEDGTGTSSLGDSNSQGTVQNESRSTLPNDVIASHDEEIEKVSESIIQQQCIEEGNTNETNPDAEMVSSLQTFSPQDPSEPVGVTPSPVNSFLKDDISELDECNPHNSEKSPLIDENDSCGPSCVIPSCVINIEGNPKCSSGEKLPVPADKTDIIKPGKL